MTCSDYHSLSLTRILFHAPKVTPPTNQAEVRLRGLKHRTSNTPHRDELKGNSLLVDQIKGCAEINRHDPSLLPTLQCTLHCGTLNTTLTSLLQQQSTIMCCDQSDRNNVNIENTELPISTEPSLYIIQCLSSLSTAALKSIWKILASFPLSNALCSVRDKHTQQEHVRLLRL